MSDLYLTWTLEVVLGLDSNNSGLGKLYLACTWTWIVIVLELDLLELFFKSKMAEWDSSNFQIHFQF